MKFEKGRSGNPQGRPKGPSRSTVEARALCRELLADPEYRRRLRDRLLRGKRTSGVEALLWHYAYGKPRDVVQLEGSIHVDADAARAGITAKLDLLAERLRRAPGNDPFDVEGLTHG